MNSIVAWAKTFAMGLGGPGLFIIALIDASVLSMPEVNDILVVWMTLRHPSWMLYYAAIATSGSVLGSLSVYYVGRKGGEALLRRKFSAEQIDKTMARFRRWGMATVAVPAIMPPPTPFKFFCLAAGVTGMTPQTFAMATGLGRGIRYAGEGLLALYFGEMTLDYLAQHGNAVAWVVTGLTAAAVAYYYWRHQRRSAAI